MEAATLPPPEVASFTPALFEPFPKISRLNREVVITEKLDGSNAAIIIEPIAPEDADHISVGQEIDGGVVVLHDDGAYWVGAQSRKRLIAPGKQTDLAGFAGRVRDHAEALVAVLGPGRHFGEWYGSGIQRTYGLTGDEKYFALFNVGRWADDEGRPITNLGAVPWLTTVPLLAVAESLADRLVIAEALTALDEHGSFARGAAGFERPEGIVLYHKHSNTLFKVTLENDDKGKEWGS